MTHDSKRFLHPEAIQRLGGLEIRARRIVEGFLSGMHQSPYFGQSIEFRQHRQYVPGDEPRHVDWKAWAKHDRLYVKQYEEDTNLRCSIVVDVSASMEYGRGPLNKYEYAATTAATLSYLLLHQQDAVGTLTFDDEVRTRVPVRSQRGHFDAIVASLQQDDPRDKTDVSAVLRDVAKSVPRRGLIVIISDLLHDVDQFLNDLRLLRIRDHDVIVIHVMDDDELDFPFNGSTRFEGLESDEHLHCNPRSLRDGYLEAVDRFLTRVRRGCAKEAVQYQLLRTSEPLDAALSLLLSQRWNARQRV